MKGRKFTDLTSGKIVEVKDQFEDIVILDNNSKIKSHRLLDKNYFDEYVDPNTFFKNDGLLNSFAHKIRQIPDNVIQNMNESSDTTRTSGVDMNNISGSTSIRPSMDESAVLPSDPELEKEELMRKYNIKTAPIDPSIAAQKQMEKFQSFLQEEPQESPQKQEEQVQRVEVSRDDSGEVIINNIPGIPNSREFIQPKVDPIIQMFQNVKRNTDLVIDFKIENKIPRKDFIEMMEESYNTSIIDFLADEFTNNILQNPSIIKDKIKDEIKKIVYGSNPKSNIEEPPIRTIVDGEVKKPKKPKSQVIKEGKEPRTPIPPKDRKIREGKEPEKPKSMI